MSHWRVVAASVVGTSHKNKNELCQDAFAHKVIQVKDDLQAFVCVVSDGAGGAQNGRVGAQITVAATLQWFEQDNDYLYGLYRESRDYLSHSENIDVDPDFDTLSDALGNFGSEILDFVQSKIKEAGTQSDFLIDDYACTLLVAIVIEGFTIFLQIGDGAIVYSTADQLDSYKVVAMPQQGEYANITYFVTDRIAHEELLCEVVTEPIAKVALFTDGLQRLALDYAAQMPHAPFFQGMFGAFDNASIAELNDQLTAFLDSKTVNDRTDDDKTLVLATLI